MSLTTAPELNNYIERIVEMLTNSALLFPNTIGEDEDTTDLVNQVLAYEIPLAEAPPEGAGPPHIFVTVSKNNPIIQRKQRGRDSRDAQGPEDLTLEFYIIVVAQAPTLKETEKQLNSIVSAVGTTLDKNKRMLDKTSLNPIAKSSQYIITPYLLDTDQREQLAKNVIFRPEVYINLR